MQSQIQNVIGSMFDRPGPCRSCGNLPEIKHESLDCGRVSLLSIRCLGECEVGIVELEELGLFGHRVVERKAKVLLRWWRRFAALPIGAPIEQPRAFLVGLS